MNTKRKILLITALIATIAITLTTVAIMLYTLNITADFNVSTTNNLTLYHHDIINGTYDQTNQITITTPPSGNQTENYVLYNNCNQKVNVTLILTPIGDIDTVAIITTTFNNGTQIEQAGIYEFTINLQDRGNMSASTTYHENWDFIANTP